MSKLEKVMEFIGSLPDDVKIHMSSKPIEQLSIFPQGVGPKPRGLWYDCEKEWINWVSSEMPDWVNDYIYLIKLNKSKILQLDDVMKIVKFTNKYKETPDGNFGSYGNYYINWEKVSSDYAGVEICPYQWSLRMESETSWYYGWDVASGCVWNPIGIDVHFIGMWDSENNKIISKDEVISGERLSSSLNWYKVSKGNGLRKLSKNFGYGCWISPDGAVNEVEIEGHADFGRSYLKSLYPSKISLINRLMVHEVVSKLLDMGFIKVLYNSLTIEYNGELSIKQKSRVIEIIRKDDSSMIYVTNDRGVRTGDRLKVMRFINGIESSPSEGDL